MIIDDEIDITNLFKEILTNAGYKVDCFTDPLKALAECKINHTKYVLIISDVRMPKMSGIELVKKIAEIDNNLILSAFCLKVYTTNFYFYNMIYAIFFKCKAFQNIIIF